MTSSFLRSKHVSSCPANHSNLECFLDCITPSVPTQLLPKSCIRDLNSFWQPLGKDKIEYFNLGDLWSQYNEWSAYGAGTPVLLNSGETVVQYYVPYLSAIQIYTSKSNIKEENDVAEFESDSWSEDSESDKLSRSMSNNSSKGWDAGSEDSSFDQDGSSQTKDRCLGYLYLEYFERSAPYGRVPLLDKIVELAREYPGLLSLKNVDLAPASWMAVAWYPIYHIPAKRNVRGLSACFLTYHTLSSSFQETLLENNKGKGSCFPKGGGKSKGEETGRSSLPPFGMATYKMHGELWVNPETADQERIFTLLSAANSWLKQLRVQHHDYDFFITHSFV